jgi:hypothetical protein
VVKFVFLLDVKPKVIKAHRRESFSHAMKLELIKQTLEISNFDDLKKNAILRQIDNELNGPVSLEELESNIENLLCVDNRQIVPRKSNKPNVLTLTTDMVKIKSQATTQVKFEKVNDNSCNVSDTRKFIDTEKDTNNNYERNNSELSLVKE